jgi:hypothetical protein
MGNPLAWDRYAYANNNPLNYTDPSGHVAVPIIIGIIGLVIAFSQIPSDVRQNDSDRQGNPAIFLIGLSLAGLPGDAVASTVDYLSYGCDPVSMQMALIPGPSPSMIYIASVYITYDLPSPIALGSIKHQNHHFATDKSSTYTLIFEEIVSKYGLDLNDPWNIAS